MNKSDLVRKTAKIAGAPGAEASLFFEIFIRSAADILSPGDVIQIKDLGFLHYKVAKANSKDAVKDFKSAFPGSGWIDLIIYSESPEKIHSEEPIYFAVPGKYELDFAEIDAPFSLSINKPVIQQIQKREAFFLPQSYNELIRLLEAKAARLLVTAKVLKKDNKQNEVFIPGGAMVEDKTVYPLGPESETVTKDVFKEPEIISPEKPEEKNKIEEEPQSKFTPGEEEKIISQGEEFAELKKEPETESFEEEKKEEMPGETHDEVLGELKEEPGKPDFEEENKTQGVLETEKAEEQRKEEEVKAEQFSGEELKNEELAGGMKETEAEASGEQEVANEEKIPPDKDTPIDKLLSKGSFGANIPWKFDEISIIEPGRREETEEEYSQEKSEKQPSENVPVETGDEIASDAVQAEGNIAETPGAGEAVTGEDVQKPEKSEPETDRHEIHDENLYLGSPVQEESIPAEKTEVPEPEEQVQETEEEPQREPEFKDSGEPQETEKGADETEPGTSESKQAGLENEASFQRIDFSDTEGMAAPEENIPEPEEKNEQDVQPSGEVSQLPSEDKDYEVIKPVKLKYDWREGFLKETDEPQVPGELKEKEEKIKEKDGIPDEEGYIEIKPGVSKEKIDFLADTEEEEILKDEKIIPDEDQAQKDLKDYISKIEEIDRETTHKRRNTTILAVIVFLLFVGVGVFLYYQYIFKKSSLVPGKKITVVVKNAKTIERDFEIPVNYPYSKNENKSSLFTQPLDSSIIAASQLSAKKVSAPQTGENNNAVVPSEPPKLENLGDYIFRQGNDYIVQIASFETQTRADAQVGNLKKANYDSYVRVVQRPDGSTYYAVMIRGFKSYDEAKNFLK